MYSLLILVSLLGAKADLNTVLGSGAFNYSLDARVQSKNDHLAKLNSVEAVPSLAHPSEDLSANNLEDEFSADGIKTRNRDFAPKQSCDQTMTTCLSFLNQLTKSIASRNATEIRKHFYRSFNYMGCKKRHYLDDVVAKLSKLPFQQGVFAILGSQRYYVDGYIAFNATIHGLFARPTKSEFVLFLHIGTLLTGNVIDCSVI